MVGSQTDSTTPQAPTLTTIKADCEAFLRIVDTCTQIIALRVGSIEAEFSSESPKQSIPMKMKELPEPGLPEHVKEQLREEQLINENLLPDETDA